MCRRDTVTVIEGYAINGAALRLISPTIYWGTLTGPASAS